MEELKEKIRELVRKKKELKEISEALKKEDYEIIGLIKLMKESGELIDYENGHIIRLNKALENNKVNIPVKDGQIKFVAISDIHFGSKWDNPKLVEYAYEVAERDNCQFVTNSGDIFEGDFHNKRPDHIYQVKALGMEQLDYVVDKYPHSSLPTYYIMGNHGETFIKTCGADICKMLADKRPDLTYLGADLADLCVGKTVLRLRHGNGNSSYAKSYKLQKYCETLPINDIPDIILQGHFHYSAYFKNRDIHCFNVPSLQGYTPFAKSLGLPQEMGFWEISCDVDNRGDIVSITPTLYEFNEKPAKLVRKKHN